MNEEELKGILNHCLNNAMVGKNRIKGTVSSNDIAEFINEWLPKQSSLFAVMQSQTEKVLNEYPYKHQLKKITQLNQNQSSLKDQLQLLRPFANKLGLYDAADYIKD
jgi:hypothetical protein